MNFLRKLLFPITLIYDAVTRTRNFFYDKSIFTSSVFDVPTIVVGNLSTGGTGKSPQIEYLIRFLSKKYKIATLSRGYKRKTEGFVLANESSNSSSIGDEPFQFYKKFKNILVAVDANRKHGIEQLLNLNNKPDIILLDDAFQHRKVKAGFYILLTPYADLYCNDYIIPAGNLRESRAGANRANVVLVTKCPASLSENEKLNIEKRLNLNKNQQLFFTKIQYDDFVYNQESKISISEILSKPKLIVAGIANPKPFFDFLKSDNNLELFFQDHHDFSASDVLKIKQLAGDKIIITTEKDFVRLFEKLNCKNLFYLPIKNSFLENETVFQKLILDYLVKIKN